MTMTKPCFIDKLPQYVIDGLVKVQKHPSILFMMLDERDYSGAIWDMVKPEFATAVATEGGNDNG